MHIRTLLPILILPIPSTNPLPFGKHPYGSLEPGQPCQDAMNSPPVIQAWQDSSSKHLKCRQKAAQIIVAIEVTEISQHI